MNNEQAGAKVEDDIDDALSLASTCVSGNELRFGSETFQPDVLSKSTFNYLLGRSLAMDSHSRVAEEDFAGAPFFQTAPSEPDYELSTNAHCELVFSPRQSVRSSHVPAAAHNFIKSFCVDQLGFGVFCVLSRHEPALLLYQASADAIVVIQRIVLDDCILNVDCVRSSGGFDVVICQMSRGVKFFQFDQSKVVLVETDFSAFDDVPLLSVDCADGENERFVRLHRSLHGHFLVSYQSRKSVALMQVGDNTVRYSISVLDYFEHDIFVAYSGQLPVYIYVRSSSRILMWDIRATSKSPTPLLLGDDIIDACNCGQYHLVLTMTEVVLIDERSTQQQPVRVRHLVEDAQRLQVAVRGSSLLALVEPGRFGETHVVAFRSPAGGRAFVADPVPLRVSAHGDPWPLGPYKSSMLPASHFAFRLRAARSAGLSAFVQAGLLHVAILSTDGDVAFFRCPLRQRRGSPPPVAARRSYLFRDYASLCTAFDALVLDGALKVDYATCSDVRFKQHRHGRLAHKVMRLDAKLVAKPSDCPSRPPLSDSYVYFNELCHYEDCFMNERGHAIDADEAWLMDVTSKFRRSQLCQQCAQYKHNGGLFGAADQCVDTSPDVCPICRQSSALWDNIRRSRHQGDVSFGVGDAFFAALSDDDLSSDDDSAVVLDANSTNDCFNDCTDVSNLQLEDNSTIERLVTLYKATKIEPDQPFSVDINKILH